MAWNHRSRVTAMAIALQAVAGTFTQPSPAALIAGSSLTNSHEAITADDPTATGTVWEATPIYLGETATVGATLPLRGPAGTAPPAANAWIPGLVLQSAGWAEIIKATASTAALVAGSTSTALNLATTESPVDNFLLGTPIQNANIGAGFQQTSMIVNYTGATRTARLGETLGTAPAAGANYTIPAYLSYVLGTLTTTPPILSISVWRDKKRYDYRDWSPTSLAINVPVSNEANTGFPDMTFSGRAVPQAIVDDVSPVLSAAVLGTPVAAARNGKFYLDRVKLGHQNLSFTEGTTVGAASNQNQPAGQDGYDILSGTRAISLDLNQMAVTDFDLHARIRNQVVMPIMTTWGAGAGNNWGFIVPAVVLNPFSPGDRNGYVNMTGDANTRDVDKSAALSIWWT